MVDEQVATHIYSKEEMADFSKENWRRQKSSSKLPKTFQEIINTAYALELFLKDSAASNEYPLPHGMHHPNKDYSDQKLINICCLVDTG